MKASCYLSYILRVEDPVSPENPSVSILLSLFVAVGDQFQLRLEVSTPGLFRFDRLEERLEVALTERLASLPLNQLEEECRPVL